jgi:UDP-hydrolysing UDP-N-acetyl-D-glucosamine 2-epimerase
VIGDRFELLGIASSSLLNHTPLAHISGGDITEGALDNQVRHAVSKLAHAHFPATEAAKQMLLAMNEDEARICRCGEPGLDQIKTMEFLDKEGLFGQFGLDSLLPTVLLTFHPDTLTHAIDGVFIQAIIQSLTERHGFQVMATGSNFDEGGDAINRKLREIAASNPKVRFEMSLGQLRYYSMLNHVKLMIGNSSSGMIEAQSFEVPVVNVGCRQEGRFSNPNVMNVPADVRAINEALPNALGDSFRKAFAGKPNVYGDGNACTRIVEFLRSFPRQNILVKR